MFQVDIFPMRLYDQLLPSLSTSNLLTLKTFCSLSRCEKKVHFRLLYSFRYFSRHEKKKRRVLMSINMIFFIRSL
jgi:hypothetical protein